MTDFKRYILVAQEKQYLEDIVYQHQQEILNLENSFNRKLETLRDHYERQIRQMEERLTRDKLTEISQKNQNMLLERKSQDDLELSKKKEADLLKDEQIQTLSALLKEEKAVSEDLRGKIQILEAKIRELESLNETLRISLQHMSEFRVTLNNSKIFGQEMK